MRLPDIVCPQYLAWMHCFSCLVAEKGFWSECAGRLTVHHVRRHGEPRNDFRVLPLCEAHHQKNHGELAVHAIGKTEFMRLFHVDIEHEIVKFNALWIASANTPSEREWRLKRVRESMRIAA